MKKLSFKQRVDLVKGFCRNEHPNGVDHLQVAYEFDVSPSQSRNFCGAASRSDELYEYEQGTLRYLGDPMVDEIKSYYDEKEAKEKAPEDAENYLSKSEAGRINQIFRAKTSPEEDQSALKMPKKPKEKWTKHDERY